jgi:hypothetical protein
VPGGGIHRDALLKSDGDITVVNHGPMTNLALAMRFEPAIVPKIREIVLMGGSHGFGNVTPAAEFNIITDAEAAHVAFSAAPGHDGGVGRDAEGAVPAAASTGWRRSGTAPRACLRISCGFSNATQSGCSAGRAGRCTTRSPSPT